jgi:hypothetical protein
MGIRHYYHRDRDQSFLFVSAFITLLILQYLFWGRKYYLIQGLSVLNLPNSTVDFHPTVVLVMANFHCTCTGTSRKEVARFLETEIEIIKKNVIHLFHSTNRNILNSLNTSSWVSFFFPNKSAECSLGPNKPKQSTQINLLIWCHVVKSTKLHDIKPQKTTIWTIATMKTSNLIKKSNSQYV